MTKQQTLHVSPGIVAANRLTCGKLLANLPIQVSKMRLF